MSQARKVAADSGSVLPQGEKRQRLNQPGVGISTIHTRRLFPVTGAIGWERVNVGKMDIKKVYRNIPVHPDNHHLLAVQWEGVADVDRVLPFGLRSAPLIFSADADAVQWMHGRRELQGHSTIWIILP